MREIKFQAFHDGSKTWLEFRLHELVKGNVRYAGLLNWREWTGLLDKNGKEIYEGDIVKYWRGNVVIRFGDGGEGEPADYVGYYNGWCAGDGETTGFIGNDVEVIGNIYENGDMLK